MSTKDDGGPAFPIERVTAVGILAHTSFQSETEYISTLAKMTAGMSLRDYAAIQFAAAILANPQHHEYLHAHGDRNGIALQAADSYIEARSK